MYYNLFEELCNKKEIKRKKKTYAMYSPPNTSKKIIIKIKQNKAKKIL